MSDERLRPRAAGLRWIAGGVVIAIAGAIMLATASANAAPRTVTAELSLSGIATTANLLGGEQIGVHPGDSVNFVPSTIPTAGLTNIPTLGTALDSLLQTILGKATGYQITLHLPATFPGGARNVTLGACSTQKNLAVNFPTKGNYTFTWSAVAISPLCLLPANIGSLAGNQLKNAGIALNATNQWVANIHVATDAVAGGLSIQLPGVSIAPSLPGVGQLGSVGIPGLSLGLPTVGASTPAGGGSSSSSSAPGDGGGGYTPPAVSIPGEVVPHPDDTGTFGGGGGGFGNPLPTTSTVGGPTSASSTALSSGTGVSPSTTASTPNKQEQAASNKRVSTAQLPVLLAILAIIALALVTGTYARLYMMRQNS